MEKKIHHNLRMLRLLRGFNQQYVAEKLGISQRAYSKLENGQTAMTLERMNLICIILECNHNQLMGLKIDVIQSDKNENPGQKNTIDENKDILGERNRTSKTKPV